MRRISSYKSLLLLASLLLANVSLMSQTDDFIKEISPRNLSLSSSQRQKLLKIQSLPDVVETKIIEIGDITNYERNGLLPLFVPGLGKFTLKANRVKYTDSQTYEYSGNFTDSSGHCILVSLPEGKAGHIVVKGQSYTIIPIDSKKSALIRFSENADAIGNCPVTGTVTQQQLNFCAEANNTCAASVHVLVLITPEAQNFFISLGNPFIATIFVNLGIAATNTAFSNSGIPNKQITYEFVSITNFTLSSDIFADIDGMEASPTIQNLRSQYNADLVVMLTDDRYGTIYGIANDIGPCFTCAYAIVAAPRMIQPRWTFAHEVAHLFGARHNRSSNGGNDNANICSHGWRFTDGTGVERRTLMATLGTTQERILHFSNPNIAFNGVATGTATDDNARIIRNSGCTLAGYFPPPSGFRSEETALIDGPSDISLETPSVHTSFVDNTFNNGGKSDYQYEWKWSNSPIGNSFSFPDINLASRPNISISDFPSLFEFEEIWLVLNVTSKVTGETNTVRRKINLSNPTGYSQDIVPNLITKNNELLRNNILLYPNPAQNNLMIQLLNAEKQTFVGLSLTNSSGSVIKKWEFSNETSSERLIQTDVSDLSAGIYFVNYTTSAGVISKKLIIAK